MKLSKFDRECASVAAVSILAAIAIGLIVLSGIAIGINITLQGYISQIDPYRAVRQVAVPLIVIGNAIVAAVIFWTPAAPHSRTPHD
jgi:hypothetical protein